MITTIIINSTLSHQHSTTRTLNHVHYQHTLVTYTQPYIIVNRCSFLDTDNVNDNHSHFGYRTLLIMAIIIHSPVVFMYVFLGLVINVNKIENWEEYRDEQLFTIRYTLQHITLTSELINNHNPTLTRYNNHTNHAASKHIYSHIFTYIITNHVLDLHIVN